ncbi:MFS transporter [Cytophagaceae bacterium ABcell3]|nr:MFS transporter [Cytophagaceae bacterium ABcell3]
MIQKNNKKVMNAWCMYDWANSVFALTITTAIFPVYFNLVAKGEDGSPYIPFLGTVKHSSVVFTWSVSIAFLIIAFLSPILSGIADSGGRKKAFMKFFVYLGSVSCALLFFFDSHTINLGIVCFILGAVGFAGSIVFYNAYLPEIATPDRHDRLSAKGFSMGYIGSVILLILNILMLEMPHWFGMAAGTTLPARISFLSVGAWWLLFSFYSFYYLPADDKTKKVNLDQINKGFKEINSVFKSLKRYPMLMLFLAAFFFYSMGFQTIMYLASIFGADELKLPQTGLIVTILIIQLVAIGGAYMFAAMSERIGNIMTLFYALILCVGICVAAWFIQTDVQFYALAVLVGLVMGGLQSLSRSTYSKMLPETKDTASYFSFYEFTEKTGIVLGTAVFAVVTDVTGSMRNSILALLLFFFAGLYFLWRVRRVSKSKVGEVRQVETNSV